MTRRELRDNVFKMLFRIEFHEAEEMPEQLALFEDELDTLFDGKQGQENRDYLTNKCNMLYQMKRLQMLQLFIIDRDL